MSNFIASLIRTFVPIGVGGVISWLALEGVEIDAETQTSLVIGLTGLLQAGYYAAVRIAALKWPALEVLLGSARQPEYTDGH